MKINGKQVIGNKFAYDGCHKIYILEDKEDIEDMKNKGYNENDIHDIKDIEKIYKSSCSLRFIENWKLTKTYVSQFENARFEY